SLRLFAAVGQGASNRVMTSPDGINWTAQTDDGSGAAWQAIVWCPSIGRFVAVGADGNSMYSTDGVTWTSGGNLGTTTGDYTDVAWAEETGTLIAGGPTSGPGLTNIFSRSTDGGATWTQVGPAPTGTN